MTKKNDKTVSKSFVVLIVILVMVIPLVLATTIMLIVKPNGAENNRRVVNPERFIRAVEKEGCVLEDTKSALKVTSYKTKQDSCLYEIVYIIVDNNETIEKLKNDYYNEVSKSEDIKFDNSEIVEYGLNKRVFGSKNYNIILSNKVMFLYLKTDLNNKEDAIALLTDIGFKRGYFN